MKMIKQMKGKMFDKLPKTKLPHPTDEFYTSIKYDGNYVQIHLNEDNTIDMYTSGNKRFYLNSVGDQFREVFKMARKPLILEAEYLYNCEGKLGDRVNSARLTTYRTLYSSFTEVEGTDKDIFKVFNIIDIDYFIDRVRELRTYESSASVHLVEHTLMTYAKALNEAHKMASEGWEGIMLQDPHQPYLDGKRVNTTIKIKFRPELVATVVEEEEGEGRLEGSIGALRCEYKGITFSVGSGLDDYMRAQWGAFIGTKVEIEYEQLSADGIPLQPTFKRVKER